MFLSGTQKRKAEDLKLDWFKAGWFQEAFTESSVFVTD